MDGIFANMHTHASDKHIGTQVYTSMYQRASECVYFSVIPRERKDYMWDVRYYRTRIEEAKLQKDDAHREWGKIKKEKADRE